MSPGNIIRVACLIAGFLMGFTTTHLLWAAKYDRHLREETQARLKGALEVIDHERAQAGVSAKVGADVAAKTNKIQYRTREVIRYVPQVITPETDRRYPLPYSALRLYDSSLGLSELAGASGEPDDAPAPIATSNAFAIIAANNGECLGWREQVIGWQQFWTEQKALQKVE